MIAVFCGCKKRKLACYLCVEDCERRLYALSKRENCVLECGYQKEDKSGEVYRVVFMIEV